MVDVARPSRRGRLRVSKNGHALTALALATVIFAAEPTMAGAVTGVGAVVGASFPDSLECPSFYNGPRDSLIPHRSLTHFAPLWLLVILVAHHLSMPWWAHALVLGVALAALLHIAVDAASPMGVPLLHPFRRHRLARPWYRTGTASEFPVIALFLVVAGGALYWRGPAMAHVLSIVL
jgi:inner membrane protein